MFTRIQWRIAASYVVLIAVVLIALGAYLVSYLQEHQTNAEAVNQVAVAVAAATAFAAFLSVLGAILIGRITTRPIHELTASARRLAFGNLDQTMPVHGRDEVSQLALAFNEMAARLRAQLQTVDDERARLAIVLGHMAHGLVITDQDGTVRMINPTAAGLLQVSAERAEGRSVMAVLRDHELSGLVQAAVEGKAPGAPQVLELGPAGSRRIVEATASRIPGAGGVGSQVLLVLQDVTEVRRADRVRREFVANVSHELRTPVASLKALAETLAGGAVDDSRVAKDFLARMEIEIDGLAQLVEELLELTRIESGQVALRLESADLAPVITAAAERLRPQAERQGVGLRVLVPKALPEVRADPDRIVQVVVNLVHNAVKFTPPGGWVEVSAERNNRSVAVTVADTGAGIPEDALPRLFERFYKTDPARTGTGTGLGLAIVKHIVQAHGGEVSVESREGEGSRFSFTIPLNQP